MNIPNPDGTRKPCPTCSEPTVMAQTATGLERVHCGTYTHRCHTPTRKAGAR